MRQIYKYSLPFDGTYPVIFTLDLPREYHVLKVDVMDGDAFLWAEVRNPEVKREVTFTWVNTGDVVPPMYYHLATLHNDRDLVLHDLVLHLYSKDEVKSTS